jgi:hypothetical protein
MRNARVTLAVAIALLLIGGSAQAQAPFENPELADVRGAVFTNFGKNGYSVVMATMYGGYGNALGRLYGFRYAYNAKSGNGGILSFDLYEPDDVRRSGAGSWQMKQTDFVQMAFSIHSAGTSVLLSNASPYFTYLTGLYSYTGGSPLPSSNYWLYIPGSPALAQLEGCNATITTKDKNQDGLPESASWKASCNPKALGFLSPDDQKLYKKVLKAMKGKAEFPAYRAVYY